MNSGYARNLSGMENLYRTFELDHTFYIQWVIDFESLPNNLDWRTAIDQAAKINPGTSLRIRPALIFKRWIHTPAQIPYVETVCDGTLEDALVQLPPSLAENGPACDVRKIAYNGGVAIVFRVLHSIMDAHGLWLWLSDCFGMLNDKQPAGHPTTISDEELSRQLKPRFRREPLAANFYRPLTAGNAIQPRPFYGFTVAGSAKGLSKKLCHLLKRYAKTRNVGELHFMIPSDLRKYDASVQSTGNLTGILEVKFNQDTSDAAIDQQIRDRLKSKSDAAYVRRTNFWKYLPRRALKPQLEKAKVKNRFPATGIISNVGDLNPADVTIGDIRPRNAMCLAPHSGFHPLFLIFSSFNNKLTLNFAIPEHLQGDAPELVEFIREELQKT